MNMRIRNAVPEWLSGCCWAGGRWWPALSGPHCISRPAWTPPNTPDKSRRKCSPNDAQANRFAQNADYL